MKNKVLLMIADGLGDRPEELGWKTPLEAARKETWTESSLGIFRYHGSVAVRDLSVI